MVLHVRIRPLHHPDLRLWDPHPPQCCHRHFTWDYIICLLQLAYPHVLPVSSPLTASVQTSQSPICPSTVAVILPSGILSSNFYICLSNVMILYFTGLCTYPFLFYIRTISPVLHSSGIFQSLMQVFFMSPPASPLAHHQCLPSFFTALPLPISLYFTIPDLLHPKFSLNCTG